MIKDIMNLIIYVFYQKIYIIKHYIEYVYSSLKINHLKIIMN